MNALSKIDRRHIVLLVIAAAAAGLEGLLAKPIQYVLAYPSAHIASVFLGVPPLLTEGGDVFIPLSHQFIHVTAKCSAFGFSCLLYAILVINVTKFMPKERVMAGCLLAIPPTYLITVLANGSRIVCAYYFHTIGRVALPANFQAALHQGVGIAVFLGTLILVTIALERISVHRRKI